MVLRSCRIAARRNSSRAGRASQPQAFEPRCVFKRAKRISARFFKAFVFILNRALSRAASPTHAQSDALVWAAPWFQLALPVARHRCKAANRVFAAHSFIGLCMDDRLAVPVPRTRSVSPFTTRHHTRKRLICS